eukprot:gene13712-4006_t
MDASDLYYTDCSLQSIDPVNQALLMDRLFRLEDWIRDDTSGDYCNALIQLVATPMNQEATIDPQREQEIVQRFLAATTEQWGTDEGSLTNLVMRHSPAQLQGISY